MKPNPSFVRQTVFTLLFSTLVLRPSTSSGQGPLNPPPGPPAPSMKSLDQIEPRTNLQANPPPTGVDTTDAAWHFVINQPGSYYLSANLGVAKIHGIQINAAGVTLDLNGFEISRTAGAGGNGIEITATSHHASIRQGSIKGFNNGIESLSVGADYPRGCSFRDLTASYCTGDGIHAGEGAVLESCRAHGNSGTAAIRAERGSSLSNCTAFNNTTAHGIVARAGSSLSNCSASGNTGDYGIVTNESSSLTNCSAYNNTVTWGISAGAGSSVTHCSATDNVSAASKSAGILAGLGSTVSHSTARGNLSTAPSTATTGIGFLIYEEGTVQNCTASANEGDGIRITARVVARDNSCSANGANGDGAGIHATSADNRIDGNNVSFNDRGIDVDVQGNLISHNTARGNAGGNFQIAAGNRVATITVPALSAAISGNGPSAGSGTTDPMANVAY